MSDGHSDPGRSARSCAAVSVIVFGIAALTILGILGFNLAPLLASTAVLGVALGFGAQNLVRDYLAGLLMLVEDHYGVGDTINAGVATGTVEAMTLLTTGCGTSTGWSGTSGTAPSTALATSRRAGPAP